MVKGRKGSVFVLIFKKTNFKPKKGFVFEKSKYISIFSKFRTNKEPKIWCLGAIFFLFSLKNIFNDYEFDQMIMDFTCEFTDKIYCTSLILIKEKYLFFLNLTAIKV